MIYRSLKFEYKVRGPHKRGMRDHKNSLVIEVIDLKVIDITFFKVTFCKGSMHSSDMRAAPMILCLNKCLCFLESYNVDFKICE